MLKRTLQFPWVRARYSPREAKLPGTLVDGASPLGALNQFVHPTTMALGNARAGPAELCRYQGDWVEVVAGTPAPGDPWPGLGVAVNDPGLWGCAPHPRRAGDPAKPVVPGRYQPHKRHVRRAGRGHAPSRALGARRW